MSMVESSINFMASGSFEEGGTMCVADSWWYPRCLEMASISCKVTSSGPHVYNKIAYWGVWLPWNSSNSRAKTLRSLMLPMCCY